MFVPFISAVSLGLYVSRENSQVSDDGVWGVRRLYVPVSYEGGGDSQCTWVMIDDRIGRVRCNGDLVDSH